MIGGRRARDHRASCRARPPAHAVLDMVAEAAKPTAEEMEAFYHEQRANFCVPAMFRAAHITSPDGQRIVTASSDHTARVWNVSNAQLLATLLGHSDKVEQAAFSVESTSI